LLLKKLLLIFFIGITFAISIGYPTLYLNDELITANQLNHLVLGKNLLFGYEPYENVSYSTQHHNTLCYTLALPVISYPVYQIFSVLQDSFRLFVIFIWIFSLMAIFFLINFKFPKDAPWNDIRLTYGIMVLSLVFFLLNLIFYYPFDFSRYGEVAALVFTNNLAFALLLVFIFLIFREIFESDWWGAFGVVGAVTFSSFLFWSGNAKDHMFSFLFIGIAVYFFIMYIEREDYLYLISSFIAIGWLAWVRPELGFGIFAGFVVATIIVAYDKGWRYTVKSLGCCFSVLIGALPLFLNNYGLMGNPLRFPSDMMTKAGTTATTLPATQTSGFAGLTMHIQSMFRIPPESVPHLPGMLFGVFIHPNPRFSAGIVQVSPISVFAFLLFPILVYYFIRKMATPYSKKDLNIIVFASVLLVSIFITYMQSLPWISNNIGQVPDMRYLAPAYLPLIILGFFALKMVHFDEKTIKKTLKWFLRLAVIVMPLLYLVYQFLWATSLAHQLTANFWTTYLILLITVIIFLLVLFKKVDVQNLALPLAGLMVSALSWELIVDFRFSKFGFGTYTFWLPLVEQLWKYHAVIFHI
jgi:hypothetical protein